MPNAIESFFSSFVVTEYIKQKNNRLIMGTVVLTILACLLSSGITGFVAYLIIKRFVENEQKKSLLELKKMQAMETLKVVNPIRLQAYERLALFLERISPNSLVLRCYQPGMDLKVLQGVLTKNIRDEFEHNLSQQVYVSSEAWNRIKEAKEETKEMTTMVLISTSFGDMKAILYNETPLHRDNFIKLVKEGYYDGTLFHRVIDGFMIQGGDPDSKTAKPNQMLGQGGPGYTVPAEFKQELIHKKGALAAARMGDNVNPQKASSGSQFYIAQGKRYTSDELNMLQTRMGKQFNQIQKDAYVNEGGVPFLDYEYTVFGQVIEGLEVIDKIAKVQKDRYDRPVEDVKMTISIVE